MACYLTGGLATTAWADPPSTIPTPPPGIQIGKLPSVQPMRVATIAFSDASVVLTRAAAGKFQMVAARPGETIAMVVPFPLLTVGGMAAVQALDGGKLLGASPVPIVNGGVTIHFQVGTQPGLYRVLVMGQGPAATVQFWVHDPQRPATNPWAVNASHWESR